MYYVQYRPLRSILVGQLLVLTLSLSSLLPSSSSTRITSCTKSRTTKSAGKYSNRIPDSKSFRSDRRDTWQYTGYSPSWWHVRPTPRSRNRASANVGGIRCIFPTKIVLGSCYNTIHPAAKWRQQSLSSSSWSLFLLCRGWSEFPSIHWLLLCIWPCRLLSSVSNKL